MKILSAEQLKEADAYTIKNEPILSLDLMERAATQLAKWIVARYSKNTKFIVFVGPGNNGGDGLALLRLLYKQGFINLSMVVCKISKEFSVDFSANLKRLETIQLIKYIEIIKGDAFPPLETDELVIDAIFGSGLNRPIQGYWANLIAHINQSKSECIAVDLPSGLFATENLHNNGAIIQADITLSFQVPKASFFYAENYKYVGSWYVLPIGLHPKFLEAVDTREFVITKERVRTYMPIRHKFDHKGTFGHGFLVAGSFEKTGAAILAAKAALRSGLGLLTVHVPQSGYEIMQTAVPEAMLYIDETESNYCKSENITQYSTVAVGPGVGIKKSVQNAFKLLLESGCGPMVIDADALNILSINKAWLDLIPENSILTPHPGEFDRLTKKHLRGEQRVLTQRQFAKQYKVIVILKGAHTSIATPNGLLFFNNIGNPGMATAGSGDVLTGILLSLLSQNVAVVQAAQLGVYVHALAGDIAKDNVGEQALIASDIIECLGKAFMQLNQ